jgi:hypothetical protein
VNAKRYDRKAKPEDDPNDPVVTVNGQKKRFSQLTSDEKDAYYGASW